MTPRLDFASDTTAPAAPEVLRALEAANTGYASSYGDDEWSVRAGDLIRGVLDADVEVRFVASATAANAICVAALCRPFEAVLAHVEAHILTHEAGAPGLFGHGLGLIGLPGDTGKIDPGAFEEALKRPDVSYMQSPAALSITTPTEYGGVYSTAAMTALGKRAKQAGLGVHVDGARLANAIAAGFDAKSLKTYTDLLVFGGAKSGMTGTEAIVIFDKALSRRFDARLKQAGQLPAKGRFYAAPFIGMLEDGAVFRYAAHANAMAAKLAAAAPFPLCHPVESNAAFLDIGAEQLAALNARGWMVYPFEDGSVRFTTAWCTTEDAVEELIADMTAVAG
jgi:threonine aldolase